MRALAPANCRRCGAHLVTPWLGFAHHGIYVGEGRVVHYGALMYDIIRKPVEEVSLESFAEGRPVFVVEHGEACLDAMKRCAARARGWARNATGCSPTTASTSSNGACTTCSRSFQAETALAYPRMMGERIERAALGLLRRIFAVRAPVPVPVKSDPPERR